MDTSGKTVTCVTVNGPLARGLKNRFDAGRLAEGLSSWEAPDILPFPAWIARTWEEYSARLPHGSGSAAPATLLDPFQEHALWERVIRDSLEAAGVDLLQVPQAAGQAMSAWARVKGWRIAEGEYRNAGNENIEMFARWADTFARLCREHAWIDSGSALDVLIAAIRAEDIRLSARITFAGFDTFTPQQLALRDALGQGGARVDDRDAPRTVAPLNAPHPHGARVALPDEEAELKAAARWVRSLLRAGADGPIGVVIPELARLRPAVSRVFDDVLCPEAGWPDSSGNSPSPPRPFALSLGEPLARVPLARDALLALSLEDGRPHPISRFSQFLLSPYFVSTDAEFMARIRLDVALRAMGEPWLDFPGFRRFAASSPGDWQPPTGVAEKELPRAATLFDWARIFADRLAGLGWPGGRPPDGEEYQAIDAFRKLLARFAGLNLVLGECSFPSAVSRLRQLAERQRFQPMRGAAPIEILGIREAVGLGVCPAYGDRSEKERNRDHFSAKFEDNSGLFDENLRETGADLPLLSPIHPEPDTLPGFSHLWVLGLGIDAWPPPSRPNPFLPVALQRRAGMPQAGPEIALAEARRATGRMLESAGEVVVSYSRAEGDPAGGASPLIAWLPETTPEELGLGDSPDIRYARRGSYSMEALSDDQGPAIDVDAIDVDDCTGEDRLRGGTRIWQDQAACPFRGFARHRLGASGLDMPAAGLDYAMRGMLVHRVLELLWEEPRDSNRLAALAEGPLRQWVDKTVDRALREAAKQRPRTLRGRLRELERQRLAELVMEWLALEKNRPPFTVIARERGRRVRFGGIPVTLRPDRMDRTAEGEYLLLDYKTGSTAKTGDWFGERPASPQLPLYAVMEAQCSGIALALVRRGEMALKGIAARPDLAPGVTAVEDAGGKAGRGPGDWEGLREQWRRTLTALAASFLRGEARVDPVSEEGACRYCDLHALCRIRAAGL
uniref:Probable DNA repair protein n=1 Tax=Candidatus Kentrum sp. DK TaxID=2126562 RepID=A0A450SZ69_9GAMM|nr:MAG: probable DNA repair protein [Candidatus Kentron sp. DK]